MATRRARRGRFITFEGLDGSGKTTQLERLATSLRAAGHEVVVTREPGGTAIGERVRAILLDSGTAGVAPLTELALMYAARAQHVSEVIRPALKAGRIVLSDRFADSSEAYQGGGRQLGAQPVHALHRALTGNLQPDLTLLLVGDAESVDRARKRNLRSGSAEGRFEKEESQFFARVRKAYQAIAKRDARRVAVIQADRPIAEVERAVRETVRSRLKL
jgi:dTMP kinase